MTDLYRLRNQATLDTVIQASFTFSDEGKARMALISVWNETCHNGRDTHRGLLATPPTVRMTENKFSVRLKTTPQIGSVCIRFLNVFASTLMEIVQEVSENLHNGFPNW